MGKYTLAIYPYYPAYKYFWQEVTEDYYKLWGKKTNKGGTRVLLEYTPNLWRVL